MILIRMFWPWDRFSSCHGSKTGGQENDGVHRLLREGTTRFWTSQVNFNGF